MLCSGILQCQFPLRLPGLVGIQGKLICRVVAIWSGPVSLIHTQTHTHSCTHSLLYDDGDDDDNNTDYRDEDDDDNNGGDNDGDKVDHGDDDYGNGEEDEKYDDDADDNDDL